MIPRPKVMLRGPAVSDIDVTVKVVIGVRSETNMQGIIEKVKSALSSSSISIQLNNGEDVDRHVIVRDSGILDGKKKEVWLVPSGGDMRFDSRSRSRSSRGTRRDTRRASSSGHVQK